MKLRLIDIPLRLYIGDLPWEKTRSQQISVTLTIVAGRRKPPDYWAVSKALINKFSKTKYEWLEDLAEAMGVWLKKEWGVKGRLCLSKRPRLPKSPKVFQVELDL